MNIVFRVDSSRVMGSGHLMRCLTLAEALRSRGNHAIHFICRSHPGDFRSLLDAKRIRHTALPEATTPSKALVGNHPYEGWLGVTQDEDAHQTLQGLGSEIPDWLVVDHYSLDALWESTVRENTKRIMVIDDLANRRHNCDILLDQTLFVQAEARYAPFVHSGCRLLLGPSWALVRPEFSALRKHSLSRRTTPNLGRVLIFMGGSDASDETAKAVEGVILSKHRPPVDVVVGAAYTEISNLQNLLRYLPGSHLYVQTDRMAQLMMEADFAITAGGTITWEKCVMGLPGTITILEDNQMLIAQNMHQYGAQITIGRGHELTPKDYARHLDAATPALMSELSSRAAAICDGYGVERVSELLLQGKC